MRFDGFVGPTYALSSVNADAQRCVNIYPELNEIGTGKGRERYRFVPTPGLKKFATVGNGPIRGVFEATNGLLFVASGNKLYRVSSAWEATEIGTLQTSMGPVNFKNDSSKLVIVDGSNGYFHTLNTVTTTQITDPDWRGSKTVDYIDGYFLFTDPNTGLFYILGPNSIDFDALDFSVADGAPDNIVSSIVNHGQVWLFGEQTIEGYYNSGNVDFPFDRIPGGFIELGCAAAYSVSKMGNVVFWLGKNKEGQGIVYKAIGFQPQRISNHAIEHAIQSYGDISDAVAWTYQRDGHNFYVLNFTSANRTWVYDSTTNLWHERSYSNNGSLERHRANCHAFAHGKHVVGDYANGNIYELSESSYSDDGTEITRMRRCPHLSEGLAQIFHHSFQLDMEAGVGLDGAVQDSDPKVVLRYSDDGGHSWSNEKWVSVGAIGKRRTRAIWRRLGRSRDRIYEVKMTDPVRVNWLGAELNLSKGNH